MGGGRRAGRYLVLGAHLSLVGELFGNDTCPSSSQTTSVRVSVARSGRCPFLECDGEMTGTQMGGRLGAPNSVQMPVSSVASC